MRRQRGVTLSGFIMWAVVFIVAALIGFKIGPSYLEFMTIQKHLKAVANDSEARSGDRRAVENSFIRRTSVEDVKSVTSKDLIITKEGDGIVITVDYSTCAPVVANLRACMDFSASSKR
jgi:hypothetical protein